MVLALFYILAAVTVLSGLMVVVARNPVHAVLFLILAFFNAAGIMLLAEAEFLAMMLVIVYVGAVAVLFLFVVMMLDVDFATLRAGFARHAALGGLVGAVLLAEMLMLAVRWPEAKKALDVTGSSDVSNTEAIGRVLYTDYILVFQAAGFVLLTAMIGAIVLTLRERPGVRRQSIAAQVARRRADGVAVVAVKSGEGVPD